jgi:hypothetical protein
MIRIWTYAEGSAQSAPGARPDLAELSWETGDGAQRSVGSFDEQDQDQDQEQDQGQQDNAHIYEFETQVEAGGEGGDGDGDQGEWRSAGLLRLLVDVDVDGGRAPLRRVAWRERSGEAFSLTMCPATPTGEADVTHLVVSVKASAEHPGAGEVAANLVQPSARKWFAPHNRALLEFELSEPIVVERYVLTSANDAPDRDPGAWTLSGSRDGRRWRTLDTRTGRSSARRHESATYRIAEPGSYDRYRLDITGSNGSPHLQLESVRFLADDCGRFVGYRQSPGCAPVAYRGERVLRANPEAVGKAAHEESELPLMIDGYEYGSFDPFVVRTDFSDDAAWESVLARLRVPVLEGEPEPEPCLVCDRWFDGAPPERVLRGVRAVLPEGLVPAAVFLADAEAMRAQGHPLLAVTTEWNGNPFAPGDETFITQYRTLADAAVEISVNLELGNMDFQDFAGDEPHERWI